ncbi:hypothetical protein FPQ18DRAFT_70861 [Pyronema domesticum]|uniref:Similar to Pumilio domain-containing protein P35G2.14 acc. no. Q9P789 n=1 Tax=Pyronema omphalodes (strain CBS 100304) TaxID=1076935 RepID=U4KY81_PYROM|nr:hypothetical protein FPQ18DRAFT_70861 [Pyronema domesticum]CCX04549.1 Similar to Pumilio domain-containing protein P35G2.14; acc. no. Q9P789 [Pyronema omphalodes CBS 100304]
MSTEYRLKSNQPISSPSSGRNTANSSPTEASSTNPSRYGVMNNAATSAGNGRLGAGSPSYEASASGRLFSKRAREIQEEEGVAPPKLGWGSPISSSSMSSSSLRDRENIIPESPPANGFADPSFTLQSNAPLENPSIFRRARAGTVPSRFSPGGLAPAPSTIQQGIPSTSRPSPASSPFHVNRSPQQSIEVPDPRDLQPSQTETKSRLRSGSLNIPPPTNYVNPFTSAAWAGGPWPTRERSQTNSGLPQIPSSPSYSSYSRDDDGSHMASKTLDYLGLVDTPQAARATLARSGGLDPLMEGQRAAAMQPFMADLHSFSNRISRGRSYSVNATEKYAADEEEEDEMYSGQHSGSVTPQGGNSAMHSATAHAMALAAYGNGGTPSRARARTAGVLDAPPVNRMKSYLATPSKLDSMTSAADLTNDYFDLHSLDMRFAQLNTLPSGGEGGLQSIDESQLEGPTRSLWLGNIPASTTTTSLIHIFQPFGTVESARVLTHKNCGFINYTTPEHAIQARIALNGKEIFPGAGPTRIGFAKPSSSGSNGTPTPNGGAYGSPSPDPTSREANGVVTMSTGDSSSGVNGDAVGNMDLELPPLDTLKGDITQIVGQFGATPEEIVKIEASILQAISYNDFEPEIPTIGEPSHTRTHDAPKLRDIRKKIDNGNCSAQEIEAIAMDMLPEVAELSSDYLGNTVVQKLFEFCSEEMKETMLTQIGPHLAEIGIHKNGTWAGQKIIDVAKTPAQMNKITDSLRPYTVALFLDQYGNYVLQCCLRFGAPFNDYIFETMLSRMWEIAQGRFGSRAMRACLESHHANKSQQRMLAAAIAIHSVQLATNTNGALLLTWFLDTCSFPNRRTVLAPRLVPHLVHLCTHKVAYLTVLKVINQKTEPEARETILEALFCSPNDATLEAILKDSQCGATLIFKVLTTPFFDEPARTEATVTIRNVLTKLKATPSQGYKRLMDEVGLSTRNQTNPTNGGSKERESSSGPNREHRVPIHQTSGNNQSAHVPRHTDNNMQAGQFYTGSPMYDPAIISSSAGQFSAPIDPQTLRALEQFNNLSLYGGAAPAAIGSPAFQFQVLSQQMANRGAPGFFQGIPGFSNPQAVPDQLRGAQGNAPPGMGNHMLQGMGVGVNPAFNPMMPQGLIPGYGYGGMNGIPMFPQQQQAQVQMQQQQQQQHHQGNNGGRRGGRR